jgi:hypothetical protein
MTPDDLPCKDAYHWEQFAGNWWCMRTNVPTSQAAAVIMHGHFLPAHGQFGLQTPAEVQSYYAARPSVACPFAFEAKP